MGGGWVGYLFTIFGCGAMAAVIGGATFALYAVSRARERRSPSPRVHVKSVSAGDPPDAA